MNRLLDKIVLFTLCLAVYLLHESGYYVVVPVIIAVLSIGLCAYFTNKIIKLCFFSAYAVACAFMPQFLLFLPEMCYELRSSQWRWLAVAGVPVALAFYRGQTYIAIFTLLLTAVGWLMSYRTETLERARSEFIELRDSTRESEIKIKQKNRELLQKQDYEINLATLSERNRIARDIHDTVGHLLSSSILQVGAIMATCKDEREKERLLTVKDTLTQGMDSIRSSIHNLYDDSIDLYTEVKRILSGFAACPVTFDYDLTDPPDRKVKYAFIVIIKEALTNIARHSGATAASISLREQPAFYALAISDNGRGLESPQESPGIGLRNITERVEGIGGILNIDGKNGFKIYISVPKEH